MATPGPEQVHRTRVENVTRQVRREFTPTQRRALRGVEPRAVGSIGKVGGREIAGQTFYRPKGAAGVITRGLQFAGVAPPEGVRISSKASDVPATVRHELTHALLFKRGVAPQLQHPVMDLARVRTGGAGRPQVRPGLLPYAQRLVTGPDSEANRVSRRRLNQMRRRLAR